MRLATPEIAWHGKFRILSVSLYCKKTVRDDSSIWKLASGGEDSDVKIWSVAVPGSKIEFRANLKRHDTPVNVVRFSPNGDTLASGSDDNAILLWKYKSEAKHEEKSPGDDELPNKEIWSVTISLRGHTNGVYDLAWSPDSAQLISASIDCRAIVWDVARGKKIREFDDHDHYVQGVCWDPKNRFVATQSADRTLNIYSVSSKRPLYSLSKTSLLGSSINEDLNLKQGKLFCEESAFQGFFRRPAFSPDGSLLIAPAGKLDKVDGTSLNTSFVMTPAFLSKPVLHFPSPDKPTVAVRFSPIFYQLRDTGSSVFDLPYRLVFAVATSDTIVIYDTQQTVPIALVGRIHYAPITDLSWSGDGRLLVVSSSDGYCSFIEFDENELGTPYASSPKDASQVCNETPSGISEKGVSSAAVQLTQTTVKSDNNIPIKTPSSSSPPQVSVLPESGQETRDQDTAKSRRLPLSALKTL